MSVHKTRSPEETRSLGERMARELVPGDVLLLYGDLGSGKTTFVQGLARGLGVPEEVYVVSPSFALIHEYPGRIPLFHVDLYRLSPEEVDDLGLAEIIPRGVTVIEWSEHLPEEIPARYRIYFRYLSETEREIRIERRA